MRFALRPSKKRSLLRLTRLKFLRAGGWVFFFLLNIFYTQIRCANFYFSRAGNSNSGTGSLAARRTSLPESPRPRECVGRLATYLRATSCLKFLRFELRLIVFEDDVKKFSTRAWIAAQKPGSTVKISFPLLDFYSSTSLSRSRSTTQLATHGTAPKSIGREVEKKRPVGASKHGRSG